MREWLIAAVVLAAVVVLVIRRLRGEPLVARELFGAPVILVAIGAYSLTKLELTVADALWVALGSAIGLGFGAARAVTTRLFERDGVLWLRYTLWTFAVWVVAAGVNFGFGALAVGAGMPEQARPMTLSIGVSLLGEALAVASRAKVTGLPYARPRR
ncbi:DUF1453 domain-containing protein [Amycolatopsis sp. OK19-0408]|uniref:DUF1453 domain-containing protein n=1 Tax=Amycolatopsis iheyensis TaxID=2945988 RepID=A0A9X2NBC5_9PSEU|nr:DUF1453 domain-containing protein [Amycolatopsis iheyensis]MCR6484453.1 DUF1453 domain-containing protein [Amycolatopsis iheyensis]